MQGCDDCYAVCDGPQMRQSICCRVMCGWAWKPCLFRAGARCASHHVYRFVTQAHRTLMQTPVGELVVGDLVGAAVVGAAVGVAVGAAVSAVTKHCINPARSKYWCAYQPLTDPRPYPQQAWHRPHPLCPPCNTLYAPTIKPADPQLSCGQDRGSKCSLPGTHQSSPRSPQNLGSSQSRTGAQLPEGIAEASSL